MNTSQNLNVNLTVDNFFNYYIFDNYSSNLPEKDQTIARIAAIAFGFLTVGLGLIVVRLFIYDKDYEIKIIRAAPNVSNVVQNKPPFDSKPSPSQSPSLPSHPVPSLNHAPDTTPPITNLLPLEPTAPSLSLPHTPDITLPLTSPLSLDIEQKSERASAKMKEIEKLYLSTYTPKQLNGCLKKLSNWNEKPIFDLKTLEFSTANQGQLLNAIAAMLKIPEATQTQDHSIKVKIADRWEELEMNGEIAPPHLTLEDGLFLRLNFNVRHKKYGECDHYDINSYRDTFEMQSLREVIKNWANWGKGQQKSWNRGELATILNISLHDLNSFCEYLQILQPEISRDILNYYFNAFLYLFINYDTAKSYFEETESIKNLAYGSSALPNGSERFPGLNFKEEWTLTELATYLAVNEDQLQVELTYAKVKYKDGKTILSQDVLDNIGDLSNNLQGFRTQPSFVRFANFNATYWCQDLKKNKVDGLDKKDKLS